eukprot:TRINITY_DN14974_c0_g1_i2.p1 TRINITY_DN14974_c0_g1~~TRINITY_DN14974_c0_g1_i2.p1  ORF type:complete len:393 (+),score=77.38 TRINITY_DN14974_c0_g1_i2:34-1212(+)
MRRVARHAQWAQLGRRGCREGVPEVEYWKTAAHYYQERLQALQQFTGQCARMSAGFDDAARGWEFLETSVLDGATLSYDDFFENYAKISKCCVIQNLKPCPPQWGTLDFWGGHLTEPVSLIEPAPTAPRGLHVAQTTDISNFIQNYATRSSYTNAADAMLYFAEFKVPAVAPWLLEDFIIPKYFAQDLLQFAFQNKALRDAQVENREELEQKDPRAALPALWMGDELYIINGCPEVQIAPRGCQSSLYSNSFSQHMWVHVVSGVQEWYVFHPDYAPALFDEGSNTYALNAIEPDWEAFPSAIMAYPTKITLRAGDTLFIPADSPVQWRVLEDSITANMPYVDWSNVETAVYDVERNASCGDPSCREIKKGFKYAQTDTGRRPHTAHCTVWRF